MMEIQLYDLLRRVEGNDPFFTTLTLNCESADYQKWMIKLISRLGGSSYIRRLVLEEIPPELQRALGNALSTTRITSVEIDCLCSSRTFETSFHDVDPIADRIHELCFYNLGSFCPKVSRLLHRTRKLTRLNLHFLFARERTVLRKEQQAASQFSAALQSCGWLESFEAHFAWVNFGVIMEGLRGHERLQSVSFFCTWPAAIQEEEEVNLVELKDFFASLSALKSFRAVRWSGCFVNAALDGLRAWKSVTEIVLESCNFSLEDTEIFVDNLEQMTWLRSLTLDYTMIGHEQFRLVAESLRCHPSIQQLQFLSNSLVAPESDEMIGSILCANKVLKTLVVKNRVINLVEEERGSGDSSLAIASGLQANSTLEAFQLSRWHDCDVLPIVNAYVHPDSSLRKLNLEKMEIGAATLSALLESLVRENNAISEINLSFNLFGDESVVFLASFLSQATCCRLQRLILRRCKLTDRGVARLVSSLSQNRTLQVLDVEGASVGQHTISAITENLSNLSLREFTCSFDVSMEGVLPLLMQTVDEQKSLLKLNLAVDPDSPAVPRGGWTHRFPYHQDRVRVRQLSCSDAEADVGEIPVKVANKALSWCSRVNKESIMYTVIRQELSSWLGLDKDSELS